MNHSLSTEKVEHDETKKKLTDQKDSIRSLGNKFNADFENMGIKILKELETQQKAKQ